MKFVLVIIAVLAVVVPAFAGQGGNSSPDLSAASYTAGGTKAAFFGCASTVSGTSAQAYFTGNLVGTNATGFSTTKAFGIAAGGSVYQSSASANKGGNK